MGVSFRLDRRPSFRVPIYGGEEALFLRAYQQLEKRFEELRVLRGTRAGPVTVAPFRAWRGSRGIVAQSPKFHRSAVSAEKIPPLQTARRSLAQRFKQKKFRRQDFHREGIGSSSREVRNRLRRARLASAEACYCGSFVLEIRNHVQQAEHL